MKIANKSMEEKERLNLLYFLFRSFAGKSIDMSSFNDRLILQKIVYIMMSAGIKLNYHFGWHLRGPYSSSLASDGFALSNQKESYIDRSFRISNENQDKIDQIRGTLGSDLFDTDKLELYSSILFISKSYGNLSDEEIITHIKNRKPWLGEETIRNALIKLKDSKMFSV